MQYEITKDEFEKKYDSFLDKLSYKEEGFFHKLLTKNNKEFGVLRNQNSIYIKALTDKKSEMTISKKQLMNVVINDKNYNLASYEPVLIDYIINNKLSSNEQYKYDDYYNYEVRNKFNSDNNISEQKLESKNKNKIKNMILYGSPGVGKTHNIQELVSYIEGGLPEKDIFRRISNNEKVSSYNSLYENLVYENRVEFVTFHQSFGYEDFIEGFRPDSNGNIILEDGIFKRICQNKSVILTPILNKITSFKIDCRDNIVDVKEIIYEMNHNTTLANYSSVKEMRLTDKSFDLILENQVVLQISNEELYNNILGYLFDDDKVSSLKLLEKNSGLYTKIIYDYFVEWLKKYHSINELIAVSKKIILTNNTESKKNKYLVIDEINRGNISKIFGELITLIEEDKRDTLEVTLPYSKKPFKIPSNLYIIGTMNSTDKSIALIDIALRRRFTFLKMEPKPDLVSHVKAQNIMIQLNEKITDTLGSDYVLGHSYFMKIETNEDLDFVLEYKVKPLLEEYYYGDPQGLKNILEIINA